MAKKHNISFEEKMKYVERREFGRKGWTGNIDGNGGTYWIWKTFGVRRRQRMKKKLPWTHRTQADKEKEESNWRTVCDRHTKRIVNIQYNTSKVKVHLL